MRLWLIPMSKASRQRELQRRLEQAALQGRPRNPTGTERRNGTSPLSWPLEWEVLWAWQGRELAKLAQTEEALTRRAELEALHTAGSPHSPPLEPFPDPLVQ